MSYPELLLDSQLKWWMVVPISVAMVLVGLLRENLTFVLSSKPRPISFRLNREQQFYKRSQNFRLNAAVLTPAEFAERKASLVADLLSDKYYSEPTKTDPANPLTDPGMNDALFNMAKGNLMSFVPQTLIMAWVNFFFADSVVMKLPFLLTAGFKGMLQTGINTPDLDVRYVSAISWYFVNLFGLRPVYSCLMSDPSKAQLLVQSQQQTPTFAGPGAPKADKLFPAAAESLQIVHHVSIFGDIASRVLRQYEHSG